MKTKRGVVGKMIALYIATIFIVIVLLIFIIGSSVIRKVGGAGSGLKVYSEEETGLGNLEKYMEADFPKIVTTRAENLVNKNG